MNFSKNRSADRHNQMLELELIRLFVSMSKQTNDLVKNSEESALFEIVKGFSSVDFSEPENTFLEKSSHIITDAISDSFDAIQKDYRRVREGAFQYAQDFAAETVTSITDKQRSNIRRIISNGIARNQTSASIARRIRDNIGLNQKQSSALERYRDSLEDQAISESKKRKMVESRRNQMIRSRAKTIAATELSAAKNIGKMIDWQERVASGNLSPLVTKKWITKDPCPVCVELGANKPKLLSESFTSVTARRDWMHPPAHPNCKCSLRLVRVG